MVWTVRVNVSPGNVAGVKVTWFEEVLEAQSIFSRELRLRELWTEGTEGDEGRRKS
jgi:hypothetical protein